MHQEHPEHRDRSRFVEAYDRMRDRVRRSIDSAERYTQPRLQALIDRARDNAVELGELTQEEAHKVADYLRRDLFETAEHLRDTGRDLREWLRFDLDQVEDRARETLLAIADPTRVALTQFYQYRDELAEYHTGQIIGPGTLICAQCERELQFKETGHIPPCPNCRGSVFVRAARAEELPGGDGS